MCNGKTPPIVLSWYMCSTSRFKDVFFLKYFIIFLCYFTWILLVLSFHEKIDGVSPRDSSKAALDEKIDCCSAPVLIHYKFHLN